MLAMLPPDPLADGIAAYGRRLRSGAATAAGCVEACLSRIGLLDAALGACAWVDAAGARASALAIDAKLARGEDAGPLMGVPVLLKDNIAVNGLPMTAGSALDAASLCGAEGSFVRSLRAAGCIILGKAETCELAIGSAGVNYLRGTPRNPWDAGLKRVPGGSSSGSAVAVAAGLCGFAVGTDTGGSVRTPAAFCGVVGIKFSAGSWGMDGIVPMSRSLDSIGILTRSAEDASLVAAALHGKAPVPAPTPPPALAGLRLARPLGFQQGMSGEVRAALDAAFAALERAGARFVDIDSAALDECAGLFHTLSGPELPAEFLPEHLPMWLEGVNPNVRVRLERGAQVRADDYLRAQRRRVELEQEGARLFERWDALLGPTKLVVAPPCPATWEAGADDALAALCAGPTRAANVMRLAALSMPVPPGASGLPVGLQVVCAAGNDAGMLAVAHSIEAVLGLPAQPDLSPYLQARSSAATTRP